MDIGVDTCWRFAALGVLVFGILMILTYDPVYARALGCILVFLGGYVLALSDYVAREQRTRRKR